MVRRFVLGSLGVLTLGLALGEGVAEANGRAPATSTINFRQDMESHVVAGMTFGLVTSKDSGATWQWVCEDAIGYGGMYDPDYAYTSTGALFATTFDGLKVNRDGCVYEPSVLVPTPPQTIKFFSTIALGPDGAVYAAAADPVDGAIYKSTDNGMTFPVSATAGQLNDWWQSIEVAPSDPDRLYLTGYRFVPAPGGDAGNVKVFLLYTSTNGGQSWASMPVTDFTVKVNSTIEIVGISHLDPNIVYARVSLEDNAISDAIYRSTNGGSNWTRILGKEGALSFVVRGNGDLVAATQNGGVFRSTDNGATWQDFPTMPTGPSPHINCLVETSAGELWACTQNYGVPQVPTDGYGIMKTTDLMTWTGVLKFQDIQSPLSCPVETVQYQKCDLPPIVQTGWCGLCAQLGCDPDRECPDGLADAGTEMVPPPKGCCQSGNDAAPGMLALVAAVGMILFRRRRN